MFLGDIEIEEEEVALDVAIKSKLVIGEAHILGNWTEENIGGWFVRKEL